MNRSLPQLISVQTFNDDFFVVRIGNLFHNDTLIPTVLWLFMTSYLWKMIKKDLQKITICCLLEGHQSRIRYSELRIRGYESGSIPKYHGSATRLWFSSSLQPPTAHTPSPLSRQELVSRCQSFCVSPSSLLTRGRWRGGGGANSYNRLESLILYKPFNTLCKHLTGHDAKKTSWHFLFSGSGREPAPCYAWQGAWWTLDGMPKRQKVKV